MMKKNYVYGILTLLFANPAYAVLDCKQQPTCESLGYSKTVAANCPVDGTIACPFDPSYKKCVVTETQSYNCRDFGFTLVNKSGWCNNILTCPSDEKYTLCAVEDCSDYPLTSCPSNAVCSTCGLADKPKYRIESCKNSDQINTGTSCEQAYTGCCELTFSFDRFTDAAYCDEDKTSSFVDDYGDDNTISCSEVEIYLINGTKKKCYQCQGERCTDGRSCSAFQVCGSKCTSSCESAGYKSKHPGTSYSCATKSVALTNGTTAQCYYNCTLKPTSCTAAGYLTSTSSCSCGGYTHNVALRDGTTAKCYSCKTCEVKYGCDDCLERCADDCSMNIQNCSGYDQCADACYRDYDDC